MRQSYTNRQIQTQTQTLTPVFIQSARLLPLPLMLLSSHLTEVYLENPFVEVNFQICETSLSCLNTHSSEQHQERQNLENRFVTPFFSNQNLEGLLYQLYSYNLSEGKKILALEIIKEIDSRGYFDGDLSKISDKMRQPLSLAEEMLHFIQTFLPRGVAARTLEECLILQLDSSHHDFPILQRLISEDLENISQHRHQYLGRKYHLTSRQLQQYVDKIHTLNPFPFNGGSQENTTVPYITPDIYVYNTDGALSVELLGGNSASSLVSINSEYSRLLGEKTLDLQTRDYLRQKYQEAQILIKSLNMRCNAILKLIRFIIEYQRDFFLHGPEFMKALTLRDAAARTGLSTATVQRCVSNKYVSTDWGIFPFHAFFPKALNKENAADSSAAIKELIVKMVQKESPLTPLSDEALAARLNDYGIPVSRRTVTKYRTALGILNYRQRRRTLY